MTPFEEIQVGDRIQITDDESVMSDEDFLLDFLGETVAVSEVIRDDGNVVAVKSDEVGDIEIMRCDIDYVNP